jgi:hypothetical protein
MRGREKESLREKRERCLYVRVRERIRAYACVRGRSSVSVCIVRGRKSV